MCIVKVEDGLPKHGSPQDRGSADRYYGRPYNPHWYPSGTHKGKRIGKDQMSLIYNYNVRAERTGITNLLQEIKEAGLKMRDLKTEQSSLE